MMKQNAARLLAFLLLASMTLITGCGSSGSSTDGTTAAGDSSSVETENPLYMDLPTGDYGGATFSILNNTFTYAEARIDTEEITGEIFGDTVYNRTRKVEEALNIKIEVTDFDYWAQNAPKEITSIVMAGDSTYDCCFLGVQNNTTAITSGIYLDLKEVDQFDFDKPWWDSGSVRYYDIGGRLYTAHNEASANIHDSIWTCFFNKGIHEDNKLENLYDTVKAGKWTLDKMYTMIETATRDLNGDSAMGADDQWGLMTHNGAIFGFMHGADIRGIDVKDGTPFIVEVDDRMFSVFGKIQNIYNLAGTMTNNKHQNTFGFTCVDGFAQNKGLFLVEVLGNAGKLRDMDTDFGIIPYPKLDEKQENYIAYYSPAANGVSIPKTCSDVDRAGTVIELLSAYGYQMVRPAYYDVVLNGKTIRDDESAAMLDIIFDKIESEMSYLYKWGGYNDVFMNGLSGTTDMMSALAAKQAATQAAIDSFIEATK